MKSSKEVLEWKERLIEERKIYENGYKNAKIASKRVNVPFIKTDLKEGLNFYRRSVENLTNEINGCDDFLIEQSTFPFDLFINFIVEIISFYENNEYMYRDVVFTQGFLCEDQYVANYFPKYLIFDAKFKEEEQKLENTLVVRHLRPLYENLFEGSKFIISSIKKNVSLLDSTGLNPQFCDFPYLEETAYNLIDRRLREPEKPLQDILNDELENIKNVGSKKILNNQK